MELARLAVVLAAILVVVPGVATAALFGDDVARKQVADQGKRVDELRAQSDEIAARLNRLEEGLRNVPIIDLANQIELVRQELKALRGQIEVVGNNVEGAAKRQRDMYVDLDARIKRLEQAPVAPAPPAAAPSAPGGTPAPAVPAGPPPAPAGVTPAGADELRSYEAAQNQRRQGNYQGAIVSFQSFLGQYGKSSLAPRAQYWIGDSYFNMRDYKNAIANQQRLVAAYPDSNSVPDALLNIASSQAEMGDAAASRRTMEGLVAKYPSSDAAEKARRRLSVPR
jgi:tol-pal system protein YbgF